MKSAESIAPCEENQLLVDKNRTEQLRKRLAIAVIAFSNLAVFCCVSLIAPFYPIEAKKKNISETVVGIIYGCAHLVMFLSSPLIGYLVTIWTSKKVYISGLAVFACCDILFGMLDWSPPGVPFIALSLTIRIVESIGASAVVIGSYAIAGSTYPQKPGTVYGILEAVAGCGLMVGPTVGGGLYFLGGYGVPFWVLGGCVFICGTASLLLIKHQPYVCPKTGISRLALFRSPLVWFGSSCVLANMFGASWRFPVFAGRLKEFGINEAVIGAVFVLPPVLYTTTTPLWGYLIDRKVPFIPLVLVNLFLSAVNLLFFGPVPFLTFVQPSLWLSILTSILMGLFAAPIMVGGMRGIIEGAREFGFMEDVSSYGVVSSVFQASFSIGSFLGPLTAGISTQHMGFGKAMLIPSFIFLAPVLVFIPVIWIRIKNKSRSVTTEQEAYNTLG